MRRKKRDKNTRAFTKGYQIGLYGKSKELCPYSDKEGKQNWLSGWRSGREDNWDGLTGTSGLASNPLGLEAANFQG